MKRFQKDCHKLLTANGWVLVRRCNGGSHLFYEKMVNGKRQTTTVSATPKNPGDALRQVARKANINLRG